MNNQLSSLPLQKQQVSGATTMFAATVFVFALVALGYYMIQRNKSTVVPPITPPNNNDNIPGYQPPKNAGANAMGVLTDPNFFNGLKSLATTIADLVKKPGDSDSKGKKSRTYEKQQQVKTTETPKGQTPTTDWGSSWSATNF